MFNLILNVIRNKEKRYSGVKLLEGVSRLNRHNRKMYLLLYRLICYLEARSVLCLGDDAEVLSAYLSAISDAAVNTTEQCADVDFIYIGKNTIERFPVGEILPATFSGNKRTCLFITDIYRSKQNTLYWNRLKHQANVSVDMMWYGILFFDNKLQKGQYSLII